jgi:hypothetical protein
MFWIALLILLVFIAFLLVRESKRRAEWQLEYRYLSRHEAHSENKTQLPSHLTHFLGERVSLKRHVLRLRKMFLKPSPPMSWVEISGL